MLERVGWVVLVLASAGCQRTTPRERARAILTRHCGDCHLPQLPTSTPRARRVFALEREDWFEQMTVPQQQKSVHMLEDRKTLTAAELAEFFRAGRLAPVIPTPDEERAYRAFVEEALHQAVP